MSTSPIPANPPKKVNNTKISTLLGLERSKGMVTGSIIVSIGVVSFTCILPVPVVLPIQSKRLKPDCNECPVVLPALVPGQNKCFYWHL